MFVTNWLARRLRITATTVGVTFWLLSAGTAAAATFNIVDGDVPGFIAAIQTANTNSDSSNVINLAPKGMYVLTTVADSSNDYQSSGAAGLPYVRKSLTINGNGAVIQRSTAAGTPDFVLIEVSGFTPAAQNSCEIGCTNPILTLNGVTLMGGSLGGLHMTYATAIVQNTTITQNIGHGSGINNICGNLTMLNSTVSYNSSDSAYGGGGVFLWQFSCPTGYPNANISFSTIFENSNPGWGRGNAIGTNGGLPRSVLLKNSILASPSHPSEAVCNNGAGDNLISSLGHNILGDAADVFGSRCSDAMTAPGDVINTNPLLGLTADNGGPTASDLPSINSPAIDAVPLSYCSDVFGTAVVTDQRGVSRPQGSACDIGSVEVVRGPKYQTCLLYDATKAVPSGAVNPVKVSLCDASGNNLSSPAITLHATGVTKVSTSISGFVQDAGSANPDNDFRYDSTLGTTGGYIFNLSTKGLTTGTYNLNFTVTGDSFVYTAPFQVK